MDCSACNVENRPKARFCRSCGSDLVALNTLVVGPSEPSGYGMVRHSQPRVHSPLVGFFAAIKHAGARVAQMVTVVELPKLGGQKVTQVTTYVQNPAAPPVPVRRQVLTDSRQSHNSLAGHPPLGQGRAQSPSADAARKLPETSPPSPRLPAVQSAPVNRMVEVVDAAPVGQSATEMLANAVSVLANTAQVLANAAPVRESVVPVVASNLAEREVAAGASDPDLLARASVVPDSPVAPSISVTHATAALSEGNVQQSQSAVEMKSTLLPSAKDELLSGEPRVELGSVGTRVPESLPKPNSGLKQNAFGLPKERKAVEKQCSGCFNQREDDRYCAECGLVLARVPVARNSGASCAQCSAVVSPRHKFCPCCGSTLELFHAPAAMDHLFEEVEFGETPMFEA